MSGTIEVEINNRQTAVEADEQQIADTVRRVLRGEGVRSAVISVAVVDDPTIHRLNRQFLGHDYPTDVLSFPLDEQEGRLEGEVVVSAETAARQAERYGWPAAHELLLYLVHGSLHLAGHDDASEDQRRQMRRREAEYLAPLGLQPPYEEEETIQ